MFLNNNMFESALKAFEREIIIGGNLVGAYSLLGQISFNLKDLDSAERYFQKVLSINPDDPIAKAHLDRIKRDEHLNLAQ